MPTTKTNFENPGNERAVLSTLLKYPDVFVEVSSRLQESDFLSDHHRALFSVLSSLYMQGAVGFDLVSVVNEATEKKVLDLVGGPDYVNALLRTNADPRNIDLYIDKILDASTKYKLFEACGNISAEVERNAPAASAVTGKELIASAEARLLSVSLESERAEDAVDLRLGLEQKLKELGETPVDIVGHSTGFTILDKLINGLTPDSLTVIAARAKVGKSMFLMNMAAHLAYRMKLPILYLDTEMRTESVQMRMISHMSQVAEREIITGKFMDSPQACQRIEKACRVVGEGGGFYHKYFPGFTADSVKSLARKYKIRKNIGAIFFDYIKLPDSSNLSNAKEHQYLGFLTAALKDLAGTLNIPVVTAAQINREGANRSKQSSDVVADSDRILRYCTTLCALSRKSAEELAEDAVDAYGVPLGGTHRLQILDSRQNRQFFEGINLIGNMSKLSFRQAEFQPPGIDVPGVPISFAGL